MFDATWRNVGHMDKPVNPLLDLYESSEVGQVANPAPEVELIVADPDAADLALLKEFRERRFRYPDK